MGRIPGGEGNTSPSITGIVPPKFVIIVSTLNSEEYSSTPT